MITSRFRGLLVAAIMVTTAVGFRAVEAQGSGAEPPPNVGYLLLSNGNLLEGEITPAGDGYNVLVDGGEIHVRSELVQSVCRTLEEGYRQKKALVREGNVRDYLDLAQWCQQHGLLGCAARELAEAKVLEPRHPLIPLVERRITMSLCPPRPAEGPAEPRESPPSADELDLLVRGMPPGSVETFTQTIQPLLMNHCSTAACHGPDTESRFGLLRVPLARPPTRRLTQRNLRSTLEWIDRDHPEASPLLTEPIRAHGTADGAIFTDHESGQYQRLVNWVYQVTATPGLPAAASSRKPTQLPQQGKLPRPEEPPGPVTPAAHVAPENPSTGGIADGVPGTFVPEASFPIESLNSAPATSQIDFQSLRRNSAKTPGTASGGFAPVDPFDPEVFNRRYHRQSRP